MSSQMQHGYSVDGPSEAKHLQPFVLFDIQVSNLDVRTFQKAWLKIVEKVKNSEKGTLLSKKVILDA